MVLGQPTPQKAEAMRLWQAILQLRDLGLPSVSIKLDCLPVVNGVQEDTNTNTELGTLISYCNNLLSSLHDFKVTYIQRQTNPVAHTLARASGFNTSSTVQEFIPFCIETIVINEMR